MAPDATITNSYSMDIVIKICATLFTFLIFLFVSAWHMTKKNYKFPKSVDTKIAIENIRDLVNIRFLSDCYRTGCFGSRTGHIRPVSAQILQNKMAIVVNDLDWLMCNKPSFIFTAPFSLAPKTFKNSWKGLLFHKDSNEKDILLCLIIKGFESLDWKVLQKSLDFGLRKLTLNDTNFSVEICALLIAFESIFGYDVDDTKLDQKLFFINELSAIVNEFSGFYYTGQSVTDGYEARELIDKVEELLSPVIESAIYHCDSQYHDGAPSGILCPNLMSQIAFLRHHLKDENIDSQRITVDDFSHCLFEHFFVLSELLKHCLVGIKTLMSVAPEITAVVEKELVTEVGAGEKGKLVFDESHLESCNSLVYTKSTTQELLRLLCLGTEFDLSLAERDGQLEEYDMQEYSVVLFNHYAFCRGKCFGILNRADAELFRPGRFVKHDDNERKYLFFNTCQLVTFQDQHHIVAMPRNFVCRLLLLLLIKCLSPDYEIAMNGHGVVDNLGPQFELLYDVDKYVHWPSHDLLEE